jgi:hypothetical protein
MSFLANTKHNTALVLISLGLVSVLGVGLGVALTVGGDSGAGAVCALISAAMGVFLFRSGIRMRKQAINDGSTMHLDGSENVHTSYTSKAKPSFLKDERRDDDF